MHVNIGEETEGIYKGYSTIHVDMPGTDIPSVHVVCKPDKIRETQKMIFSLMQFMTVPEKFAAMAAQVNSILSKKK